MIERNNMRNLFNKLKNFIIKRTDFDPISKETIKNWIFSKENILLKILISFLSILLICIGISKTYDYFYQKQLQKNKEINIVFNTDLLYKDITKVSIYSAMKSKKLDSIYNINVLCVDMTKTQCEEFNMFNDKRNVHINVIPLNSELLKNIGNYEIRHYVTRTDLFKFLFPDILKNLDKVLYIDGDTLILKDLSTLYNTDIRKYRLAAVKKLNGEEKHYYIFSNSYFTLDLFFENPEYNCGVMLLNLKKFREEKLSEKLIIAKNRDTLKKLHTQTSFNEVIPYNTTKHLSPIYNTCSRWDLTDKNISEFKMIFKPFVGRRIKTVKEYNRTRVILHYAGRKKPWNTEDVRLFKRWWKYANKINPNWQYGKDFLNITEVKDQ